MYTTSESLIKIDCHTPLKQRIESINHMVAGEILELAADMPVHEAVACATALPPYCYFLAHIEMSKHMLLACVAALLPYRILKLGANIPMLLGAECIRKLQKDVIFMIDFNTRLEAFVYYGRVSNTNIILMMDPNLQNNSQEQIAVFYISKLFSNSRLMIHPNMPLPIAEALIRALPKYSYLMIHPGTQCEVAELYIEFLRANGSGLYFDPPMQDEMTALCLTKLFPPSCLMLSLDTSVEILQFCRKHFRGRIISIV